MYFIRAISTISHQNSFGNSRLFQEMKPLEEETALVKPNYKEFIPASSLRRLSPVLRMGITASLDCQKQVGDEFDAISVGTALGCLKDTEKFLVTFNHATGDFLPPTAFIQSTHNTIGGQISLALKNHSYNMTHTQNNVSFEMALLDAMMCIDEGKTNVLVGSADEHIPFLTRLKPTLIDANYPLTSCASFFALSPTPGEKRIGVTKVHIRFNVGNIDQEISHFFQENNLTLEAFDLVLHSDVSTECVKNHRHSVNYLEFTGMNYSTSAFALHVAHDYLSNHEMKNVLIVNHLCDGKLGLIVVSRAE